MRILLLCVILLFTGCVDVGAYDSALQERDAQISALQSDLYTRDEEVTVLKSELAQMTELYEAERETAKYSGLKDFPDYETLAYFIQKDKTNENVYDAVNFKCTHFSFMLIHNAAQQGWLLYPYFQVEKDHMKVIAFVGNKGILFIEPIDDTITNRP